MKRWLVLCWCAMAAAASAQSAGGLYVAGDSFDFTQAVERALAQHPSPSNFLCWPPAMQCAAFRSWRLQS